jgi:hypothetical protein
MDQRSLSEMAMFRQLTKTFRRNRLSSASRKVDHVCFPKLTQAICKQSLKMQIRHGNFPKGRQWDGHAGRGSVLTTVRESLRGGS